MEVQLADLLAHIKASDERIERINDGTLPSARSASSAVMLPLHSSANVAPLTTPKAVNAKSILKKVRNIGQPPLGCAADIARRHSFVRPCERIDPLYSITSSARAII
jgi:hypothetical protein